MIKKWLVDWLFKDTLKGIFKGLDGNKTSLGILVYAVTVIGSAIAMAFGVEIPMKDILLPNIPDVIAGAPVSTAELSASVGQIIAGIGSIFKLYKWAKGKPQNPLKEAGEI
jgi:hypothetical protein